MTALWVGAAAVLGALVRFALDSWFARRQRPGKAAFPLSTLLVNAAGSFLIGWCFALLTRGAIGPGEYPVAAAGLAGGLTTFSSWTVGTLTLWLDGRRMAAAVNVTANLVLGVAAAGAGRLLAA
ncbi:CrcB family protein [Arthrobacter sp. zg-Y820]|uniref:fluoride efflux transporter FluC n=1 Tax=unclassified Arthrobacter TaxID=235627 RepID=UPI00253FDCD6|nr:MULTISPECIES: CrcB family protein [unclassified Arthrobacter]MCC9196038.1 CrcB family protein [Arthrobacter sp. zg-Y820]MDK1278897.1 CrcB family protein [Arthrobacter sp. zg.Y820]MDK1359488.1 CrcB family protein [Arthrobacter sp. zg-Y1219]WIB08688.1 CrcB family protein [Arthrobacter sp. zg-Y820]